MTGALYGLGDTFIGRVVLHGYFYIRRLQAPGAGILTGGYGGTAFRSAGIDRSRIHSI